MLRGLDDDGHQEPSAQQHADVDIGVDDGDDLEDLDYLATRGRGRSRSDSILNELEDAAHREREAVLYGKLHGDNIDLHQCQQFQHHDLLSDFEFEPARTELSAKTLDIVTNLDSSVHRPGWAGQAPPGGGLFPDPVVYMSAEEAEEEHALERQGAALAAAAARTPSPVDVGTPPQRKSRGISGALGRRRKRTSAGASSTSSGSPAHGAPAWAAAGSGSGGGSPLAEAAAAAAAAEPAVSSSGAGAGAGAGATAAGPAGARGRAANGAKSSGMRRSSSEPPSPNASARARQPEAGDGAAPVPRPASRPSRRSFKLGRRRSKSSKKAALNSSSDAAAAASAAAAVANEQSPATGPAFADSAPHRLDALSEHAGAETADATFDHHIKVLLLGDSGVGKTSLMLRFADNEFQPNLMNTAGVDFKVRVLQDAVRTGGRRVKCQIWDTAGQERFHVITRTYYRGSHGIALVFDVTSERSFEQITYWMNNIKSHAGADVFVVLFGNKVDLPGRRVSAEQGEAAAAKHGALFYETSAKDGTNVLQAFEALSMNAVARIEAQRRAAGADAAAAAARDAATQRAGGVLLDARARRSCAIL